MECEDDLKLTGDAKKLLKKAEQFSSKNSFIISKIVANNFS